MRSIPRGLPAVVAAVSAAALAAAPAAPAQPDPSQPAPEPVAADAILHNIVYRARVDGVSRGAMITYRTDGDQFHTANPTMVPGRVFEANAVLPASQTANIRVSIEWPYSANLHCEILIDNAVVAQADDFVGPRLTPQREDPDFGSLTCQAPVGGVEPILPSDEPPAVDPPAPAPAPAPA